MMFVCIKTLSSNLISKLRQTHDTRCESWPDTNSKMTKSSILMVRRVRFNCSYMYSCFDSSINSTAPFPHYLNETRLTNKTLVRIGGNELSRSTSPNEPIPSCTNRAQRVWGRGQAKLVYNQHHHRRRLAMLLFHSLCVSRSGRHQTKFDARSTDFHLQRLMSSETAANFYLFNERDVSINAGFVGNCTTLSPLKAS